jgi:hypothetical protein
VELKGLSKILEIFIRPNLRELLSPLEYSISHLAEHFSYFILRHPFSEKCFFNSNVLYSTYNLARCHF